MRPTQSALALPQLPGEVLVGVRVRRAAWRRGSALDE